MPASIEERLQAKEEGINFLSGFGIENMNFDSNIKINYTKCISVLDDDGNFNPVYNKTIINNIRNKTKPINSIEPATESKMFNTIILKLGGSGSKVLFVCLKN